ncbi:hypothetical protein HL666_11355 [Bradyrhizobium sp. 83002]|nr:hypothetical protein [Bradyrhizobium aeschynomenes]NPU11364.1 hypothetical protein [Bradyrhizobium aeschynomenes]
MESYAMSQPPKFQINVLGFDISAEGALGISAACFLVIFLVAVYRWF